MSAASSNNNMLASITASLEKSLTLTTPNSAEGLGYSSSDSPGNPSNYSDATTTLDLNSQISLPYHWEQCLDLKQSGEIYYINWRTGMKAREDPRTSPEDQLTTDLYYTEEEEEEEDGRSRSSSSSPYDTDGQQGSSSKLKSSASPAGASSSMKEQLYHQNTTEEDDDDDDDDDQVLVVAGCKVCLMYFMVPKQVQHCPKCTTAQLLHFI